MAEGNRFSVYLGAADDRHDAAQHLHRRGHAGPFEPCQSHHLAGAQRQVQLGKPRCAAAHRQLHCAARCPIRRPRPFVGEFPDHRTGNGRDVGVRGAPASLDAAVAQHREPIGDRKNLVQAVRNEDHRRLARDNRADRLEQTLRLRLRQRRGRLVQHQHRAAGTQRAGDLDDLPVRQLQVADPRAQIDGGGKPVHRRLDLLPPRAPTDEAKRRFRQDAREDVLFHRAVGEQHQLLMHHRQSGPSSIRERAERHVAAGHAQPPAVRAERPGQHADQRGLPGTVGAEQPMHLARSDGQRNVVEGTDRAEAFGDTLGFEQHRARGVAHPRKRASRTRNWSTFSLVTISLARK